MKKAVFDNPSSDEREFWIDGRVVASVRSISARCNAFVTDDDVVIRPGFEVNSIFKSGRVWGDPNAIELTPGVPHGIMYVQMIEAKNGR